MRCLVVTILLIISFNIFSIGISLKERVFLLEPEKIWLSDIVNGNIKDKDIILVENVDKSNYKITTEQIAEHLSENGIYDITIFGKQSIVYIKKENEDYITNSDSASTDKKNPIEELEQFLSTYIDSKLLTIKIAIKKTEPSIDVENLTADYRWEVGKILSGLSDIINIKKVQLITDNKRYSIFIDVSVFGNVFISGKTHLNGDFFREESFTKKFVDISLYKDCDMLAFDIEKAKNSVFTNNIGVGDVLRWKFLKKIPMAIKDERLNIKIKSKNLEVLIPCTVIKDSYENEKIKVRLLNGNEVIGILRDNNGVKYVEI